MNDFPFNDRFDSISGENGMHLEIIEAAGGRFPVICPIPRDCFAWYEGIEDHRIYELDLEED